MSQSSKTEWRIILITLFIFTGLIIRSALFADRPTIKKWTFTVLETKTIPSCDIIWITPLEGETQIFKGLHKLEENNLERGKVYTIEYHPCYSFKGFNANRYEDNELIRIIEIGTNITFQKTNLKVGSAIETKIGISH